MTDVLAGLSASALRRLLEAPHEFLGLVPIAAYLCDAHGRVVYANGAVRELLGREPVIGQDRWFVSERRFWPDGRPVEPQDSPVALAIAERRPVRDREVIAERSDGTRVRLLPHATPLLDETGTVIGAIAMLVDVTHRYEAEVTASRLAAIVTTCDDAIVSKTLEGRVTTWNQGAQRLFGYAPDEMIGQEIKRVIPPELHDQEDWILGKIRRGERVEPFETQRVTKDGRRVEVSVAVSPVLDHEGRVVGASKVARDITVRKIIERDQALLIAELNHRVKNALATVQSIASQTLRRAPNPDDFVKSFTGRIQALARVHNVLSEQTWRGAELSRLINDQLLLGGPPNERILFEGPSLMLEPQVALHVALIVYELGTNARKHGALSVAQGVLRVVWEVRSEKGRRSLHLTWTERGGPKVAAPERTGFGTRLVEQSLGAHEGSARLRYAAEGLTCEIELPLHESGATHDIGLAPGRTADRTADGPPNGLRGRRILVVEDEPLLAMEIEGLLERLGCEMIGPAGTLAEAARLIDHGDFDAALLDANLAGAPVDALAAALTRRGIGFAFASGYGPESLPSGFGDAPHVTKPVNADDLAGVLARLLRPDAGVVRLRRKGE